MATTFTVFKGSSTGQITESQTTVPTLQSNDVLLENTHSGVCGTDAHYLHTDMVLGHEGVGVVKAVGSKVSLVKVGDRVGFGYAKAGCDECQYCLAGHTWHCLKGVRAFGISDFDQGSFATHSVWPETRLAILPDEIPSAYGGPFMCAGQTVFIPFLRQGIKPSDCVGIVGIGGLGHLAIQFAAAWGCTVVVFSSSDNKKQEAIDFGATKFYNTTNLRAADVPKINHLLVTTSAVPDWQLYIEVMAPYGHIYPLTITHGNLEFPYMPMIVKELSIHVSCSSTPDEVQTMLQFAVKHGIKPSIERFPMTVEGITNAFERLESGKLRYRGVLEV
ncbi:GroES-like protein [Trichoderma sp. SZMC 28014]